MTTLIEPDIRSAGDDISRSTRDIALFLDFDGTLVEIAPSPDSVKVDRRLPAALDSVRLRLGGALALVSGRPISFLDAMMQPFSFDAAGLHGAQIRVAGALREQADTPDAMREATRALIRFANSHVGIIVEDKDLSVALHWRLAPRLHDEALDLMRNLARSMGPTVRLQEGKAVAELVPASASKGGAIASLMQVEAYAGRLPVFIGDDITDEAGFAAVNAMGGLSVRIGAGETIAGCRLDSPTDLRRILLAAADDGVLNASSFFPSRLA